VPITTLDRVGFSSSNSTTGSCPILPRPVPQGGAELDKAQHQHPDASFAMARPTQHERSRSLSRQEIKDICISVLKVTGIRVKAKEMNDLQDRVNVDSLDQAHQVVSAFFGEHGVAFRGNTLDAIFPREVARQQSVLAQRQAAHPPHLPLLQPKRLVHPFNLTLHVVCLHSFKFKPLARRLHTLKRKMYSFKPKPLVICRPCKSDKVTLRLHLLPVCCISLTTRPHYYSQA
jgi:hypothetical protein